MIVLNKLEQGTDEWKQARCGVVTASCFGNIITPTGNEVNSKKRLDYLLDIIHEQLTKTPIIIPSTFAMQRGIDLEPEARRTFEFINDCIVDEIGMIFKDEIKLISCSPDGLIGSKQGLEIKCPLHKVHLQTLIDNEMPKVHIPQVQGSMWVTGRKEWWFMSYHPDHKPFIQLVKRDDFYIENMKKFILKFIVDVNTNIREKIA